MPGYILEKLGKAERHLENIRQGKSDSGHPLGVEQEERWLKGAIDSAKMQAKILVPRMSALNKIQKCLDEGGEAVFIVKRIKKILDSL